MHWISSITQCSFKSNSLSSLLCPSPRFLEPYQEMCRQLDALLASSCLLTQPEIKRCPRTPTARAPLRPEPQLARWARDVTQQLTEHIRHELQEARSSKLISVKTRHMIDFCKDAATAKNNYSRRTIPDPETSHRQWHAAAKEKVMTAPQGRVQQGRLQPNRLLQRSGSVQPLGLVF